jgi:DNA-binding CsgD family transcriptional regulator
MGLIADGRADREIAEILSVSPRTVGGHVSNILNKLGVNSRSAATALAVRHGLV